MDGNCGKALRESPVYSAFGVLEKNVNMLQESIGNLEGRLSNICLPPQEQSQTSEVKKAGNCQIEQQILSLSDGVDNARCRISELIDRLQL